jgi:crossover junction endodeoxyribonuclease RusA
VTNQTLHLDIPGVPTPQGSKKVINGRLIEAAGDRLKKWRKAIAESCLESSDSWQLSYLPIELEVVFYMPRPASVKPAKRYYPIVPPDLDKLLRGLLDGIGQSEAIWGDDAQVVRVTAWKAYADLREPGAEVKLWEM